MKGVKTIKRYANRKLYDTVNSSYVTLDDIAEMVKQGEDLRIIDNRTGEDLTSLTLAQIILEEEKKRKPILPKSVLHDIIRSSSDFLNRLRQPVHQFREEAERRVDRLRKGADDSLIDAKGMLKELLENTQTSFDEMSRRMDDRVKDVFGTFTQIPHLRDELDHMINRLDRLERDVKKMSKLVDRMWERDQKSKPSFRL